MIADGLMARHNFVRAERQPLSVPRYPVDAIEAAIRASVSRVDMGARLCERQEYQISERAAEWYDAAWRDMVGALGDRLDPAYIRRITWGTARYAAIYHLLLGEQGVVIRTDAMRWAWRMTQLHLQYAVEVLSLSDNSFSARLDSIVAWTGGYMDVHPEASETELARALLQRWRRDLKSANEARGMIELAMRYRGGGSDANGHSTARPDVSHHPRAPGDPSARAPLGAAPPPHRPRASH